MSTDSEREIRDCLGGALDTIEPGSAPVSAIIRRGKTIRIRRRAGIAVAAAAVIGLSATLPGLIRHPSSPPQKPSYHLTENPPRIEGQRLVFTGAINNRMWRFSLHRTGAHGFMQTGPAGFNADGPSGGADGDPANLDGFTEGQLAGAVGPVRNDVARLTLRLSNGTVFSLRPITWHGARWVGFVVPQRLRMGPLTAYSRRGSEIAHAIPFGTDYVSWLRPGHRGMARQTVMIGSGTLDGQRWKETAYAGPWGICIQDAGNGFCNPPSSTLAPGHLVGWRSCGGAPPELGVAQAATAVRQLRLSFSDGSVQRVPAVSIAGRRYFAFGIHAKLRFTGWTAYGAAGQRLGSGSGWGFC
jgi:hypothetical protein